MYMYSSLLKVHANVYGDILGESQRLKDDTIHSFYNTVVTNVMHNHTFVYTDTNKHNTWIAIAPYTKGL